MLYWNQTIAVNILRICQGFLTLGPALPGGPTQYFSDVSQPTLVIYHSLYGAQTLILDGVVVRCWYPPPLSCAHDLPRYFGRISSGSAIFWLLFFRYWAGLAYWASLTCVLCRQLAADGFFKASFIGTLNAFATATSHSGDIFAVQTGGWITTVFSTTLATNLSATSGLPDRLSCNHSLTNGSPKACLHTGSGVSIAMFVGAIRTRLRIGSRPCFELSSSQAPSTRWLSSRRWSHLRVTLRACILS